MKKIILALVLFSSSLAKADSPKFLGTFPLNLTSQVWSPNLNQVPVGDITHNSAFADYQITPDQDLSFSIRQGNTYGFGCDPSIVAARYFLVELNDKAEPIGSSDITESYAALKAHQNYLIRVNLTHLKACDAYGTSFLALIKP